LRPPPRYFRGSRPSSESSYLRRVSPAQKRGFPGLDTGAPSDRSSSLGWSETWESISQDFLRSRDHGLANIDSIVAEWSRKLPLSEQTIHSYLTTNIHYVLDEECMDGMRAFFALAAEFGVLPAYQLPPIAGAAR